LKIFVWSAHLVREERIAPVNLSRNCLRVWIDQQLRGIESIAAVGIVRTVHSISIELAWPHVGEITMPDLVGSLANVDAERFDGVMFAIEETELDTRRVLGGDREVDALAVPGCAERI